MAYFNFRLQKKILEAVSEPEPVRLVTKPLSDRITPFQTRSTKLVERFTDLYKNDRVQVTGALKGMPDRSSAERLMFTVVEVRLYNAYVHKFMQLPVKSQSQRLKNYLPFKMRLSAQPFLWKWVLFAWQWKMSKIISISKAEHSTSFWFRGPGERGYGLLISDLERLEIDTCIQPVNNTIVICYKDDYTTEQIRFSLPC